MRKLLLLLPLLAGLAVPSIASAGEQTGIVLMHGKLGAPLGAPEGRRRGIAEGLIKALHEAHYLVATPEMCWSRQRSYDLAFTDCFRDIDAAIADLRAKGASAIVLGGESLGGATAIAYGATHPGLLGILSMAPAGDPGRSSQRPDLRASIAKAHDLAAQGKGAVKTGFDDVNTGPSGTYTLTVNTTPDIFLSFSAPESQVSIPANVVKLAMPLLWVAGDKDPTQQAGPAYAFDKAPANPLNRYVTVSANHVETPDVAEAQILAWLKELTAGR